MSSSPSNLKITLNSFMFPAFAMQKTMSNIMDTHSNNQTSDTRQSPLQILHERIKSLTDRVNEIISKHNSLNTDFQSLLVKHNTLVKDFTVKLETIAFENSDRDRKILLHSNWVKKIQENFKRDLYDIEERLALEGRLTHDIHNTTKEKLLEIKCSDDLVLENDVKDLYKDHKLSKRRIDLLESVAIQYPKQVHNDLENLRRQVKTELKAEITGEITAEITREITADIFQQLKQQLSEEILNEIRNRPPTTSPTPPSPTTSQHVPYGTIIKNIYGLDDVKWNSVYVGTQNEQGTLLSSALRKHNFFTLAITVDRKIVVPHNDIQTFASLLIKRYPHVTYKGRDYSASANKFS